MGYRPPEPAAGLSSHHFIVRLHWGNIDEMVARKALDRRAHATLGDRAIGPQDRVPAERASQEEW
jgi:hypothetical protein